MIVFERLEDIVDIEPTVVALGNFDGIHKGHQEIIGRTVKEAEAAGLKSAVFTFSNHTSSILKNVPKVKNILEVGYNLGIIRYAAGYDKYFRQMMAEKGLKGELVAEFRYVLVMREDSALAGMETIRFPDLQEYIQIAHADPYVPSLPLSAVRNEELPQTPRRIFVFERGSQLDLLAGNPETFMWVSPLPERLLRELHLVQRECAENRRMYRDLLIHRQDYRLTELDKRFITELTRSKRACINEKK